MGSSGIGAAHGRAGLNMFGKVLPNFASPA